MNELQNREQQFKEAVFAFSEYQNLMLQQFFDYWSEANRTGKKMRFELEKTWDLKKRLNRWHTNDKNWNNGKRNNNSQSDQLNQVYASINEAIRKSI